MKYMTKTRFGKFFFLFGMCVLVASLSQHRTSNCGESKFVVEAIFTKADASLMYSMVVIGSGPAGIAAALYGARENLGVLIIEGNEPGGLLMKTTYVTNWPGEKSIVGKDLIDRLDDQINALDVKRIKTSVKSIDVSQWPYVIYLNNNKMVYALSIVIATGARPLTLGVPGEKEYSKGGGVTTCAICDASIPANVGKDSVVVGGGDSAIEEAMQSEAHQKEVTILVRKDHFRAAASMQAQLKNHSRIKVLHNVEVKEILGEEMVDEDGTVYQHMTGVRLFNNKTKEESIFPAQMLFLAIGHVPNTEFLEGILATDKAGYIKIKSGTQATSVEGIFAAGEVTDHRYRQAITSAGDGAKAGLDAISFLQGIGFNSGIAQRLEDAKKEAGRVKENTDKEGEESN